MGLLDETNKFIIIVLFDLHADYLIVDLLDKKTYKMSGYLSNAQQLWNRCEDEAAVWNQYFEKKNNFRSLVIIETSF